MTTDELSTEERVTTRLLQIAKAIDDLRATMARTRLDEAWTTGWLEDAGFEHTDRFGGAFELKKGRLRLGVRTVNGTWYLNDGVDVAALTTKRHVIQLCVLLDLTTKLTLAKPDR